jgi:hypothetical protein
MSSVMMLRDTVRDGNFPVPDCSHNRNVRMSPVRIFTPRRLVQLSGLSLFLETPVRPFVGLVLASIICSCADMPTKPNPLNTPGLTAKPYDGLNKTSYGALSKSSLPYCDPNGSDQLYGALMDVAKDITGKIYQPIGGLTVYDDTLVKEELQDQFRTIGWYAAAYVVVVSRDKDGISFWYDMSAVSDTEVANAANKYCTRIKKASVFQGAARHCGTAVEARSRPDKFGSTQDYTYTPTYVIATFSCMDSVKRDAKR